MVVARLTSTRSKNSHERYDVSKLVDFEKIRLKQYFDSGSVRSLQ